MAKDTRVKFDNDTNTTSTKSSSSPSSKSRRGAERQISYEETENCVNEISESFPALHNMNKAHRFMRQVSNSFSSRTIKVALILSVILNLLICIPFGIFIGIWMSNNNNNSNSNNNNHINSFHQNNNNNNNLLPSHHLNNNHRINNNNNNNNNNLPSSSSSSSSSSTSLLDTLSSSSSLSPHANNNNNNNNKNNVDNNNNNNNNNVNSNSIVSTMESCVPCSSLNKNIQVKIRSKNNFCCTDEKIPEVGGATYLVLSDEYIKRKLDQISTQLSGCGESGSIRGGDPRFGSPDSSMMTSAAHLMLNVKQTKENQKRNAERPLAWITHDPKKRSFVRNDLTYTKGHIVVQSPGVYHVYSHMTLSSVGDPDFKGKHVVHSIMKYFKDRNRRVKNEALLFTQVSIGKDDLKTTNLEGSFELEDGDELVVYVSYPSLLSDDLTANVFGLFRL